VYNEFGADETEPATTVRNLAPRERAAAARISFRPAVEEVEPYQWPGLDEYHRMTQSPALVNSLNFMAILLASPVTQAICGGFDGLNGQRTVGTATKAASDVLDSAKNQITKTATIFMLNNAKTAFIDEEVCCLPEACRPVPNLPFFSICLSGGLCLPKFALYFSTPGGDGVFDEANAPTLSACYVSLAATCYRYASVRCLL
jgi:hypothetical protein